MSETYGISFCHDGFWDSCRVCPGSKLVDIKFGIFYVLIFNTLQLKTLKTSLAVCLQELMFLYQSKFLILARNFMISKISY